MKMAEAKKIMNATPDYMVSFEHVEGGMLRSDYFPDKYAGEPLIPTEEEAWQLAQRFATATRGKCVNIHIIKGVDFTPVNGYRKRMIENR